MRKFLSLFAAMLIAIVANAAVINIDNTTGDALRLALNNANSGDIIEMAAGTYVESNGDYIAFAGKDVTVRAAEGAEVIIQPQVPVQITEGGCAHFVNVKIDASRLLELADWYEHLMYPADAAENNRIILEGCELYGFNLNKSMLYCSTSNVLSAITIDNCYIHNNMKSILFVENTSAAITAQVTNSTFANHAQGATDSYWAGIIDLRNANANLLVDHCTFYNVIPMNTDYSCVSKITLANGYASNCIFMLPTAQDGIRAMRGVTATNCITFNYLKDSGTGIHSSVTQNNCVQVDPLFVDAANGDFTLGDGSPALTMNDGAPIGDPRWAAAPTPVTHTYTVAGSSEVAFGTAWDPTLEANDMVLDGDLYKWERTGLELPAENIEFKVCEDHDWANCWPSANWVINTIAEAGIYTITITFDPNTKDINAVATKTGDVVVADDWVVISFAEAAAADDIAEDASYTVPGTEFALTLHDSGNKMAIDGNDCRFGTAEAYTMYNFRIKSGGASSSSKNYFTLNIPAAGTLRLAPRTGSNSATDRALVIAQGEDELYNAVVQESQAVEVQEGENTVKVYPYVDVTVAAGEVRVSYSAGMNFYAFAFKAAAAPQPDPTVSVRGTMNDWGETPFELSADKTYATLVVNDIPAGDYQFKMFINGEWRSNGYTFHRGFTGAAGITGNDDNNMVFQADVRGAYTFTWTFANDSLGFVYPEAPQPSTCDWDNIEFLGGPAEYANQFKVCKPENVGVVNIQQPGFATEMGIYMTFPSAAFGDISLPASAYDVQGAGIIFHLTAFTEEYTEVSVEVDGNPIVFTVYNAAAAAPAHTYTVAGSSDAAFGGSWNPALEANDMVLVEGVYKWEKSNLTLAAGTIEFKVCEDHAWAHCYPDQNYQLAIPEAGVYTITITFNPEGNVVAAEAVKTGDAVVIPTIAMHGDFLGSWADTENFTVADGNATASLTLNIAAGNYEFGMRIGGSGNWTANGVTFNRENPSAEVVAGSGNLKLAADVAGEYIFTWTYETNTLAITFPAAAPASPWEAWFGDANWGEEHDSYLEYNAETGKATVHIGQDKTGQWHAQVKYNGISSEPNKFYHVGLKMKANNAVNGVTLKWEDNTGILWVDQAINLEANTEFVYDEPQFMSNAAGNGVLVLDFGWAHNGDVIELYDVVIEEVAAPEINLENGYYLIGINGWSVYDLAAADKFAANAEADGEYMLTTTLAAGNELKVVNVVDNAIATWYPEGANYVVDNAHAGEKTIYFRPNADGGDDWFGGCIYVPANEGPVSPIKETWFANTSWQQEFESTIVWDPETDKITINVAVDKNAQWQAQLKLFTLSPETGKCYNVAFKLKANNALGGITFKWQDDNNEPNLIYENQAITLEANTEYVYDKTVAGIPGNGIAVFDFGYAKTGDIIEIYDFVITEVECPEPLEVNYYLVGSMTNWAVVAENQYLFAPNAANEAEYVLSTTLAEGDEFKVVKVEGETQTWMPDGMGNNYVVDAAHAGKVIVYFRPDGQGGDGWHYGYIYVDIDHTGIDNTAVEMKAVKVIRNGQLLIIMGEKTFNAQGQIVK